MNARDELTEILWDNAVADRVRDGKDLRLVPVVRAKAEATADAILAAGYRKPRVITTAEELEALPDETVVRSDLGVVYEKGSDFDEPDLPWWLSTGDSRQYPARRIALPAVVLWEP